MGIHSGYRPQLNTPTANSLYTFTSHTFTPAGADTAGPPSLSEGPTLQQIQSAYSSETWAQSVAYLSMIYQGIQRWTVPQTGVYRITAQGGAGGRSHLSSAGAGYPAHIRGDFNLTQGDVLDIIVGHAGEGEGSGGTAIYGAGGGGGSFVWLENGTDETGEPLIVAGGGGGAIYENYPVAARENSDANANSTSGNGSFGGPFSFPADVEQNYSGGTGGFGGQGSQGNSHGAGGGGWRGSGQTPIAQSNPAQPGKSPWVAPRDGKGSGGLGSINQAGDGGFGGGGGGGRFDSQGQQGPGGGGGYSGGAGASDTGAGGGGSYNSGANQVILTPPTTKVSGFVTIEKL